MSLNRPYSPIEQHDEEDIDGVTKSLLGQRFDPNGHQKLSKYRRFWNRYWAYFTHGLLLFMILTLFFSLLIQARPRDSVELAYSPANVAVEYNEGLITLNGTLDFPSEFRGYPTPEIDAAWTRVSVGVKPTRLTLQQLLKIGKEDTPSIVKFHDEDGGGYFASLEVAHQLHCLDLLRKYTYREHYESFDPIFTDSDPDIFRLHIDHCIEILRQNLMCSADAVLITYEWVRGFSEPYPDFNTKHKCRNFDKILQWGNDNAVHIPKGHITRFGHEVDLTKAP